MESFGMAMLVIASLRFILDVVKYIHELRKERKDKEKR
jgi:hypothetical protein